MSRKPKEPVLTASEQVEYDELVRVAKADAELFKLPSARPFGRCVFCGRLTDHFPHGRHNSATCRQCWVMRHRPDGPKWVTITAEELLPPPYGTNGPKPRKSRKRPPQLPDLRHRGGKPWEGE